MSHCIQVAVQFLPFEGINSLDLPDSKSESQAVLAIRRTELNIVYTFNESQLCACGVVCAKSVNVIMREKNKQKKKLQIWGLVHCPSVV